MWIRDSLSDFIKQTELHTEKSIAKVPRYLGKFSLMEDKTDKPLCCFTKDEFRSAFESISIGTYSYFLDIAYWVRRFLTWQASIGEDCAQALSNLSEITFDEINSEMRSMYFRTYRELYDYIRSQTDAMIAQGCHDSQFDILFVVVLLAFHGIRIEDLCDIKVDDIDLQRGRIGVKDYWIILDTTATIKVDEFLNSDGCYYLSGDMSRKVNYKPSQYLIRSHIRDHFTPSHINDLLVRYNKLFTGSKRLMYDKLYWSGVYSRAMDYEEIHGELRRVKNQEERLKLYSEVFQVPLDNYDQGYRKHVEFMKFKALFQ